MKRAQDIIYLFALAAFALVVAVPGIFYIVYQAWRRM